MLWEVWDKGQSNKIWSQKHKLKEFQHFVECCEAVDPFAPILTPLLYVMRCLAW